METKNWFGLTALLFVSFAMKTTFVSMSTGFLPSQYIYMVQNLK